MAADSTQFLIEIQTRLEGGNAAAAQIGKLGDQLLAAGASSKQIDAALAKTSSALEAAGAAAKAASDAVAASQAGYNQAETAADRAAKAVEKIGAAADAQRGKLKAAMDAGDASKFWTAAAAAQELDAKQAAAVTAAEAAKAALTSEGAALDALKAKSAAAAANEKQLTDAQKSLSAASKQASESEAHQAKVIDAQEKGAAKAAAGVMVFASALIAASAAIASGASSLGLWAIGLANAKRGAAAADSLESLSKRLHDNLAGVFGGLKIDGLLNGLRTLVNLFDASTASGRFMKAAFEGIFQPLIDGATNAIPSLERAFIEVEIAAVKTYIAIKKFAQSPIGQDLILGLKVVAVALGVVAAIAVALMVIIALPFIIGAAVLIAFIIAIGAVINWFKKLPDEASAAWESIKAGALAAWNAITGAASDAFEAVISTISGAIAYLEGIDLASMGSDLINGLVDGIIGAGGAVLSAITGIVGGAVDAAKNLLGIHSPSKVFEQMGIMSGKGMERGADKATDGVSSALESMVSPPAARGGALGGGKGGATVMIDKMIVNGENAKEVAEDFAAQLTRVLQGDAIQVGAIAGATP